MALIPDPSPLGSPYWQGANRGELMIQRCGCGHVFHPPLPVCPACGSGDWQWQASTGRGTVFSYTVVRVAAHPDFADRLPYVAALVELEEGPRMVSNLLEVEPQSVHVGMAVRATFVELSPGVKLPQFVPA
jgi:uncharacterized protein